MGLAVFVKAVAAAQPQAQAEVSLCRCWAVRTLSATRAPEPLPSDADSIDLAEYASVRSFVSRHSSFNSTRNYTIHFDGSADADATSVYSFATAHTRVSASSRAAYAYPESLRSYAWARAPAAYPFSRFPSAATLAEPAAAVTSDAASDASTCAASFFSSHTSAPVDDDADEDDAEVVRYEALWAARVDMVRRTRALSARYPISPSTTAPPETVGARFGLADPATGFGAAAYTLDTLRAAGRFPRQCGCGSATSCAAQLGARAHVCNQHLLLPNGDFVLAAGAVVRAEEERLFRALARLVSSGSADIEDLLSVPAYTCVPVEARVLGGIVAMCRVYGRDALRVYAAAGDEGFRSRVAQLYRDYVAEHGAETFVGGAVAPRMTPIEKLAVLAGAK